MLASPSPIPEDCSATKAATLVAQLARDLGITGVAPTVRTLRLWKSQGVLARTGRRFSRRNVLEALGTMRLRAQGLKPAAVAERIFALDEDRLRLLVFGNVGVRSAPLDAPGLITLHLLARGILEQYRIGRQGGVVGFVDPEGPREGIPKVLHQAMARLSRLYIEEGREDLAASVHGVLEACKQPLKSWAPAAIATLSEYSEAILIDSDYRVPSEDCLAIAEESAVATLPDLIEQHLHEELKRTLEKLGAAADVAYTTVREFIGRHPMASILEMKALYSDPDVTDACFRFVEMSVYLPVHAVHARDGEVPRCSHCNGLVGRDDRCTLQGCREDHVAGAASVHLPLSDAFVARPEVLKYWVDPAREELRLYDALRDAGIDAQLYPHRDRCDVAVGEDVGIDVKDYRDPARLAHRLNRSIGGLAHYPRRILAIADRRQDRHYVERLKDVLTPQNRARLEVMTVSQCIRAMQRDFGKGGRRARAS